MAVLYVDRPVPRPIRVLDQADMEVRVVTGELVIGRRLPDWIGWLVIASAVLGVISFVWFLVTAGLLPATLLVFAGILCWIAILSARALSKRRASTDWAPIE
jgi:hypothetical protein